jgi:hypothetical protein
VRTITLSASLLLAVHSGGGQYHAYSDHDPIPIGSLQLTDILQLAVFSFLDSLLGRNSDGHFYIDRSCTLI